MLARTGETTVGAEGIPPPHTLSRFQINERLNAVIERKDPKGKGRFRDFAIFKEAMGENEEMYAALSRFLHDVTTCPQQVLNWCHEVLKT